tara:strand:- start:4774 stop:5817 length:1044 start_codon:yes stop_codon:yes gene_type:complete
MINLFLQTMILLAATTPIFEGKDVVWGFDFLNQDEMLISERGGELYYYNIKTKEKKSLKAPKVKARSQGGLLDVMIYPEADTTYVYLTYSQPTKDVVTTALARAEYKNKSLQNLKTIFSAKVKSDTHKHYGSRLVVKDGYLFMTIGDRGERDYAQDLSLHNGKILRLNLDGSVPKDNPYVGQKGILPEIWSYGHRNPQGIDIDPLSNRIYSVGFGPRGGDELNFIEPKKNYGWPVITYGREYWGPKIGEKKKDGMEQPVVYWTPSISPSGMVFYRGDKVKKWQNQLFLANLASEHIRRLKLKDNKVVEQEELFQDMEERFRHVRNSPDGYLYASTDSGKILRLEPKK